MAAVSFSATGFGEVTHDLTRFRQNITHGKPALEGMAEVVAAAQRDQFATEGRHYGPGWQPLSPRYRAWKNRRRPGKPILVFDGNLKRVAAPKTADRFGVYQVNDRRMEVGVSYAATPTARWHQEGTKFMPARPVMEQPTREDQKDMVKVLQAHIVKGTGLARR